MSWSWTVKGENLADLNAISDIWKKIMLLLKINHYLVCLSLLGPFKYITLVTWNTFDDCESANIELLKYSSL